MTSSTPKNGSIQLAEDRLRRLTRKGFKFERFTDLPFHVRVTAKDGTLIDYWPTAGKKNEGKWGYHKAPTERAQFVGTEFWRCLNRPLKNETA